METRVERINPYIEVKDLDASILYYIETIGFDLYIHTPILGILSRDGHQIHLYYRTGKLNPTRIWIGVEDIIPLYKGLKERHAFISKEPINYSWAYQFEIEDLDKNTLIFGSGPQNDLPFHDLISE